MPKELTPVQKLAEAEAKLTELTGQIEAKDAAITDLTSKLQAANGSATKANTDLAESSRLLSEKTVALTKAEGDLKLVRAELETLKTDFDTKVTAAASAKAAEIAASQGIPPGKTTVAGKPGEIDKKAERQGKSPIELLASGAKADLARIAAAEAA